MDSLYKAAPEKHVIMIIYYCYHLEDIMEFGNLKESLLHDKDVMITHNLVPNENNEIWMMMKPHLLKNRMVVSPYLLRQINR